MIPRAVLLLALTACSHPGAPASALTSAAAEADAVVHLRIEHATVAEDAGYQRWALTGPVVEVWQGTVDEPEITVSMWVEPGYAPDHFQREAALFLTHHPENGWTALAELHEPTRRARRAVGRARRP